MNLKREIIAILRYAINKFGILLLKSNEKYNISWLGNNGPDSFDDFHIKKWSLHTRKKGYFKKSYF